jgi:hypothetical protein
MKSERYAWIWVYWGIAVLSFTVHLLVDGGLPAGAAMAVSVMGGLGIGIYWHWAYPRSLAKRLFGPVCLALAYLAFAAFDFRPETTGPNLALLGLIAGLVLAEEVPQRTTWKQQRDTALTSRQTMHELR